MSVCACVLPAVLGKVRSAVGSAQLLMSQKFQQFRGLCEQNLVCMMQHFHSTHLHRNNTQIQAPKPSQSLFCFDQHSRSHNWQLDKLNTQHIRPTQNKAHQHTVQGAYDKPIRDPSHVVYVPGKGIPQNVLWHDISMASARKD